MQTKILKQAIRIIPTSTAFSLTRALAARTSRPPITPAEQRAMETASRIAYGEHLQNTAWSWGSGPIVVLVHGWNGQAAQMAPLAAQIALKGFQAVALDITGHGSSPGNSTRWTYFMRDIASLSSVLNSEVYAYVAHSAGGLATMAARQLNGTKAQRYVCISAPSHPFPPIEAIKAQLNPPNEVLELYKNFLAQEFESSWETLASGSSFMGFDGKLLLCYDETDRMVSHQEADRIESLCPGTQVLKTKAYSHRKILTAPEVMERVSAFLVDPKG